MARIVLIWLVLSGSLVGMAGEAEALGANYRGPFEGRVVDADTGEPIEGAVVFVEWMIHQVSESSTFFDAVEVLTDVQGHFYIRRNWSWNPWRTMGMDSMVYVYKAGYGLVMAHWGPILEAEAILNSLPESERSRPGSGCDTGVDGTVKMLLQCPDREWDYLHIEGGQVVFRLWPVTGGPPDFPNGAIPESKKRLLMQEFKKSSTH